MRWQDDKMSNLEYYIANIGNQCWPEYSKKMLEHIQSHLTTPMSLGAWRALTLP